MTFVRFTGNHLRLIYFIPRRSVTPSYIDIFTNLWYRFITRDEIHLHTHTLVHTQISFLILSCIIRWKIDLFLCFYVYKYDFLYYLPVGVWLFIPVDIPSLSCLISYVLILTFDLKRLRKTKNSIWNFDVITKCINILFLLYFSLFRDV